MNLKTPLSFGLDCGCLVTGVGNPELWDRGLVIVLGSFFGGLFTPTNPLPGHRLVPESQYI